MNGLHSLMGKLLILVVFAVLSKLSCGEDNTLDHVDLAEGVEYIEEDEPLTLPPPTMQPGCVLLDKPVSLTWTSLVSKTLE